MKRMKKLAQDKVLKAGFMMALMTLMASSVFIIHEKLKVPELPTYTDPVMEASIEEEETPLASKPKVTTSTKKKTSTKKVTLKKASTKSYTKSLPKTKKTTTQTSQKTSSTVVTEKTVVTAVKEKYKKKSKIKTVTTTTTTTTKTTTIPKVFENKNTSTTSSAASTPQKANYTANVRDIAPMMDSRIINAYEKLGFTVKVDSSVSYAGYFDAGTRSITLRQADSTVYHELGHFVAFVSGNTDKSSAFQNVYNKEKSKYTAANKSYATQNSSEYFAESVKEYILQPAVLMSNRPKTYEAIEDAFNKVTDAQVSKVKTVYGPIWNR